MLCGGAAAKRVSHVGFRSSSGSLFFTIFVESRAGWPSKTLSILYHSSRPLFPIESDGGILLIRSHVGRDPCGLLASWLDGGAPRTPSVSAMWPRHCRVFENVLRLEKTYLTERRNCTIAGPLAMPFPSFVCSGLRYHQ